MKLSSSRVALLWLLLANIFGQYLVPVVLAAHASLTNINCTSLNKSFINIAECRMRLVQRDLNEITIRMEILKPPLENVSIHLQLMKKSNGFHPYLIDSKFDGCKFISTKNNPLINYLYGFISPYTNINHSCPFSHEMVVRNLRIDQKLLAAASILPSGDYAIFTTWTMNNVKCVLIQLYFKYKENE